MKDWFVRLMIVALLAVVLSAPFWAQSFVADTGPDPGGSPATAPGAAQRLVVITPHNDQIRWEFATAFRRWRARAGEPDVVFEWRTGGGTSDLRKQVFSQFTKKANDGREDEGIGVDLFFGGGPFEHNALARGIGVARGGQSMQIPLSAPIDIPQDERSAIYPQATIGGEHLYHQHEQRLYWVGTALSSFGIVWNNDVLAVLGLRAPGAWQDLCDSRYFGWIALADPAHSGSVAAAYHAVLQRKGWDDGWRVLRRVFANARYFSSSASQIPLDVSAGQAAAGMCIDFYGRYQAQTVPRGRVGYADPRVAAPGGVAALETAVTADPISILRGAPHQALAVTFVRWVLSADAQRLWQRAVGAPGGPVRFELRRMPVRRDMYDENEMRQWSDQVNPFELARPLPDGTPNFYRVLAPVAHALAIDVHEELKAAWSAIANRPRHPRRDEMKVLFDAMPDGLDAHGESLSLKVLWPPGMDASDTSIILSDPESPHHEAAMLALQSFAANLKNRYTRPQSDRGWNDREKLLRHRVEWTRVFRGNYRKIVEVMNF